MVRVAKFRCNEVVIESRRELAREALASLRDIIETTMRINELAIRYSNLESKHNYSPTFKLGLFYRLIYMYSDSYTKQIMFKKESLEYPSIQLCIDYGTEEFRMPNVFKEALLQNLINQVEIDKNRALAIEQVYESAYNHMVMIFRGDIIEPPGATVEFALIK